MRRLSLVALTSLILGAALVPAAQAANITVGPDLTEPYTPTLCGVPCTFVNSAVSGLGAHAVSPVSGEIVAWRTAGNTTGAEYRLRVMTPLAAGRYFTTAAGAVERPTTAYEASFPTALPIAVGQTIGLDLSKYASIGITSPLLGSASLEWQPVPPEGLDPAPTGSSPETELAFNAEIQPAPTIAALAASTGPTAGGTAVSISGADLEGVTSVRFGSVAATFTAKSESEIDATAPPSANAGPVPISVTTDAGTGTSSQRFVYQAPATPSPPPIVPATCRVPDLAGTTLKASKKKIRAADCKVGKLTKRKGVKAATGKVVGQNRKPGTLVPAGTLVKVTLGKG